MSKDINPEISIIIVNYNSDDLLADCIQSIMNHIRINFEIIVFDNDSKDDSLAKAKLSAGHNSNLKIIRSKVNLGFAKANNLAAQTARGRFIHFLNPDTLIGPCLQDVYSKLLVVNEKAIFVTGLTEHDGQHHKMKHLFPTIGNYFLALTRRPNICYWNIGASLISERSAFEQIGGWAEDYFMYAEDLDLFYTAYKNKIPVIYLDCNVTHIGKGTTDKVWSQLQRAVLIEKATRKFYRKHQMAYQYFIIRPVQLLFILIKEPKMFILTLRAIIKSFKK